MKVYLLALGAGLLVGVFYALINVRSPAPPIVALVGLLGILVGEQLPPLLKTVFAKEATSVSWLRGQVIPHCFGQLPAGGLGELPKGGLPATTAPDRKDVA